MLKFDQLEMVKYHKPSDREIIGVSLDGSTVCERAKKIAPACLKGKKAAVAVLNHLQKNYYSGLSKKARKEGIYFCFPDKKCVWVIDAETDFRGFAIDVSTIVQVGWKLEKYPLKRGLAFFVCVYEFSDSGRLLVPKWNKKSN